MAGWEWAVLATAFVAATWGAWALGVQVGECAGPHLARVERAWSAAVKAWEEGS